MAFGKLKVECLAKLAGTRVEILALGSTHASATALRGGL